MVKINNINLLDKFFKDGISYVLHKQQEFSKQLFQCAFTSKPSVYDFKALANKKKTGKLSDSRPSKLKFK